jgi:predicted TIM-barrel fold metal-dependent hydrolase
MTVTTTETTGREHGSTDQLLIDTDVHEGYKSYRQLIPYMDDYWRMYLTDYEWSPPVALRAGFPYAQPVPWRADWVLDDGSIGTQLEKMQEHLLEAMGVSVAILNGTHYYSAMQGHYELASALASAYNDFQIAEWLEKEPRLRGSVHVVAHDPVAAAREIDRVAEHPQIVQVFLPTVIDRQYGDPMYVPIFEAAVRNNLAVTLHHGVFTKTAIGFPRYYTEWHTLAAPHGAQNQLLSMICNGLFDRFPELKVVLLETGVAWVPWFMWRMDQQYRETRLEIPWVKRLPSEHMRTSVRVATQPMGDITPTDFVKLVEMVDADDIFVFSSDYPHYDADLPDQVLGPGIPDDLKRKVRYANAVASFPRLAGLDHEA